MRTVALSSSTVATSDGVGAVARRSRRSPILAVAALAAAAAIALFAAGAAAPAHAEPNSDTLVVGSTLATDDELVSANGAYDAIMQDDGNLVVYNSSHTAIWSAQSRGVGSHVTLQTDGNLVIYNELGQATWNTATSGTTRLVMQNDGNLVLYRANGTAAFNSFQNTGMNIPMPSLSNMYTLAVGANMPSGSELQDGSWSAVMQGDGNFVVSRSFLRTTPWNSHTNGNPGAHLSFQTDGNVVIYAASGRPLWNTATVGSGATRMVLQMDGNLILFRANGTVAFNTFANTGTPLH